MERSPLGDVCVELRYLTPGEVERVLQARGRDEPFGRAAVRLGLLDEERLAAALARQFRLQHVPRARTARLTPPPEVLDLLDRAVMEQHLLVPTFYDVERRSLSLLVSDPTDLEGLKAARTQSGAERMRLFVASATAVRELLDRILPHRGEEALVPDEPTGPTPTGDRALGPLDRAVVVEPDLDRVAVLRRLEDLEGTGVVFVHGPDQVVGLLERGAANRVLYRSALSALMQPHLPAWRRALPGVVVSELEGFGPGSRAAIPYGPAAAFYLQLVEFLLLAREDRRLEARARVRRQARLVRQVALRLGVPAERVDAGVLVALFADVDRFEAFGGLVDDATTEVGGIRRFELPQAILGPFRPPYDLTGIFERLERRTLDRESPSDDILVEVIHTVRELLDRDPHGTRPAEEVLGPDLPYHDPRVTETLEAVLRKERLHADLLQGGAPGGQVLLAERDGVLATAIEARLQRLGLEVQLVPDGENLLARARSHPPAAIVANLRLPGRDGFSLLLALKRDPSTRDVPVVLLSDRRSSRDVARGLELGAEEVMEKPVNLRIFSARLRRAIRRSRSPRGPEDRRLTGRLRDLPTRELLDTLTEGGQTAQVRINTAVGNGEVHLEDGRVVGASCGLLEGEEALGLLLEAEEGTFHVRFGVPATLRNLHPAPRGG